MVAQQNTGASEVGVTRGASTAPKTIVQAASAVLLCIGITERGLVDRPVECLTYEAWKQNFGGYTANNLETVSAVEGWFAGGGTRMFQVRTVHHTTPGDPTSKTSAAASLSLKTASASPTAGSVTSGSVAPFALAPGQTVVVSVDGGGNETATFNAAAATRTSSNTAPFALANNDTLTVTINGGTATVVTFTTAAFVDITQATALEVCAVINARFAALGVPAVASVSAGAILITTNRKGTGASIAVSSGSAQGSGKLNFSTSTATGTGNVADIANVTVAEVISVVGAVLGTGATVTSAGGAAKITSTTTGGSSSVQVISTSTATAIGFDNALHAGTTGTAVDTLTVTAEDGSYGNAITTIVAAPSSGKSGLFDLRFAVGGVVKASFPDVSKDSTSDRYVLRIVNGNNALGLTLSDPLVVTSATDLPAQGTFGPLTGGDDGLAFLADSDFSGGTSVAGKVGLRVFDGDQGAGTLLICPQRATAAVQNAMLTYANVTRAQLLFAILDPPAGMTVAQMVTYATTTAAITESCEVAAGYYPRIKVASPDESLYGAANVVVPPSGDIAAAYARNDASRTLGGAFEQPGGIAVGIPRMLGLESTEVLDKGHRDLLCAALINPISREVGTNFFLDGVLTLLSSGSFPSIGQSRGVITVSKSLIQGLAFARHRNNTPELRKACSDLTTLFLTQIASQGVLASRNPTEAFSVDYGPGLNPPSIQAQRKIQGRVGLATANPADFIYVEVFPDTRALEAQLAAAA